MSVTAIAYLLIYFGGLLVALFGRPMIGLYTYLFAFYMYAPGRWWGEALPDLRWSLMAALVAFFALVISKKEKGWVVTTEVKLFIAYVVWVWIQSGWALSAGAHADYTVKVTKFLVLMFLIQNTIKDEKGLLGFIVVNLLGCAYFGWLGYTQHQHGRFETVGTPGLDDGNLLSMHMVPMLICGSYILLSNIGKIKFLAIPPVVLVLNAVMLTQSRGGLAGLASAAVMSLYFIPTHARKTFITYATLAALGGLSLMGPELLDRVSQVTESEEIEEVDQSAYSRIVIIEGQWKMFQSNPILGSGHRGTLMLSPFYIDQQFMTEVGEGESRRGSHNMIMSILVDQGLVGAFFYFGMIFIALKRFFAVKKTICQWEDSNIGVYYIGFGLALISVQVMGLAANNIRLEIDIWLYAVLGLLYTWVQKHKAALAEADSDAAPMVGRKAGLP